MPSITESFDRALPNEVALYSFPDAHVSGPSTEAAEAPGFAFEVQQSAWNVHANKVLNHVDVSRHRLASWENTRDLRVEADVSDAAAVQLINPVDIALSARHRGDIQDLNQYAISRTVRADKCWLRATEDGSSAFAVLDYKRAGVIRDWEMDLAFKTLDEFDTAVSAVQRDGTWFKGNAHILLKQAVNYADQYQTQYIAFFDWNRLLLLVLENQEGRNGGMWCYASVISNRGHMRRALLGFLERAYRASTGSDLPPLMPPAAAADPAAGSSRRRGRR